MGSPARFMGTFSPNSFTSFAEKLAGISGVQIGSENTKIKNEIMSMFIKSKTVYVTIHYIVNFTEESV